MKTRVEKKQFVMLKITNRNVHVQKELLEIHMCDVKNRKDADQTVSALVKTLASTDFVFLHAIVEPMLNALFRIIKHPANVHLGTLGIHVNFVAHLQIPVNPTHVEQMLFVN